MNLRQWPWTFHLFRSRDIPASTAEPANGGPACGEGGMLRRMRMEEVEVIMKEKWCFFGLKEHSQNFKIAFNFLNPVWDLLWMIQSHSGVHLKHGYLTT